MTTACLCEVHRPGLAEALAARGVAVQRTARRALARCRLPAGSVLVAAMPAGDRLLPQVRASWWGPLLVMLTGADQDALAAALDAGAEDAVSEQASDRLVAARIAALLRRGSGTDLIRLGALSIDPVTRRVSREGTPIALLPREYAVLLHLARAPGRAVSRIELREAVWGLHFDPGTNVVEVHVSRLRAKLDRGFDRPMLLTERGSGYRLVAEDGGRPARG